MVDSCHCCVQAQRPVVLYVEPPAVASISLLGACLRCLCTDCWILTYCVIYRVRDYCWVWCGLTVYVCCLLMAGCSLGAQVIDQGTPLFSVWPCSSSLSWCNISFVFPFCLFSKCFVAYLFASVMCVLHANRTCKSRAQKRGWWQEVHILHVNV